MVVILARDGRLFHTSAGTFHAAGCAQLQRGTSCASGNRIAVPDGVERPRPHRNVPDGVEGPRPQRNPTAAVTRAQPYTCLFPDTPPSAMFDKSTMYAIFPL